MITIPIYQNFDASKIVGQLTIDEMSIPEPMSWTITLGYNIDSEGKTTIICASPCSDMQYLAYMAQLGTLTKYLEMKNDKI